MLLAACGGGKRQSSPTATPGLPTFTPTGTATPHASPTAAPRDARWLAYLRPSGREMQLRLVRGDGGGDRLVADGVTGFAWSPDGRALAYWGTAAPVHVVQVGDNGTLGGVTSLAVGADAAFSPDGQRLAFREPVSGAGGWRLVVAPTGGGGAALPLTRDTEWDWGAPAWTADGRILAEGGPYALAGASGNTAFSFYLISGDGTRTRLPVGNLSGRTPTDVAASPDRRAMAYTTTVHNSACSASGSAQVVGVDGTSHEFRVHDLLPRPSSDYDEVPYGVTWAGSGALLYSAGTFDVTACMRSPSGPTAAMSGTPDLFRISLQGGAPAKLLEDAAWPALSNDGQLLAYTRGAAGGSPAVVVAAADGSGAAVVAQGTRPQWRP